jgi:hypothetical protein
MVHLLLIGMAAVGGFIFGVLFGRRNKKTVEGALSEVSKVSGGKL